MNIRPAVKADFEALGMPELPVRVRAVALEHDGEVLAIAGGAMMGEGMAAAFCDLAKPAKPFGKSLHKAAKLMFEEAKRRGVTRIVAQVDPENPVAVRWVKRFGFELSPIEGDQMWVRTEADQTENVE